MGRSFWWEGLGAVGIASAVLLVAMIGPGPASGQGPPSPAQEGTVITQTTTIATDTTWTPAGSPYILKATVLVAPSATLTVTAGTVVTISGTSYDHPSFPPVLAVRGKLVVAGSPGQKVSIASREVVTNVRGYIRFYDFDGAWLSEGSSFTYADLTDTEVGLVTGAKGVAPPFPGPPYVFFDHVSFDRANLYFNSTISLTNSRLARGGEHNLGVSSTVQGNLFWLNRSLWGSGLTAFGNTIAFNDQGILAGAPFTLTGNNIYGNRRFDLSVGGVGSGNATNNWWGTTDLQVIRSHINQPVTPAATVDILPIATAPIPDAPRLYAAYFPWVSAASASGW